MKVIIQTLICCTIFGQLCAQQKTSGKHLSGKENSTWQFFEESERVSTSELAKNKALLKLGTKDELKPVSDKAGKTGMHHYRYQQIHNGVPVEWAIYMMHEKSASVTHTNGSLVYGLNLSTTPTISEEAALQTALQLTDATLYAWEDEAHEKAIKYTKRKLSATFYPSGELVIMDPQFTQQAANCRLAYKFDIYAVQPLSRQVVYIDAHSGEVLKVLEKIHSCTDVPATGETNYSGTVDFTVCYADTVYTLKNNKGGGMQVFNAGGNISLSEIPFHDSGGHFDTDATATEVHWATEKTYDYLFDRFGRKSIDDEDAPLLSWVHYGSQLNNAYWNGAWMLYSDGDGIKFTSLTSQDIVTHEIIHGLTDHTSNLIYEGQSGALNESFSDIFGEVIEASRNPEGCDWIVGADFTLAPKNGLRNMANPNDPTMITRQPDTYLGDYYKHTGFADYGGVHTNSGVPNHWFYLLTEGGTGTNDNDHTYDIEGIGIGKAAAIAYYSLTNSLLPTANFEDMRVSTEVIAKVLYGMDVASQVNSAWCAVGVGPGCVKVDCRTRDSLALVALYDSTDGMNWSSWVRWDLTQPMDSWERVTVNDEGCVIQLSLSNSKLSGTIPPEIGNLTNLEKLDLRSNKLTDTIPPEIGNLTNLEKLDLQSNELSGSIPPEIGNLTKLERLILSSNELSGTIPPEIGNLTNLEALGLSSNELSGTIPPEIGNMANLEWLRLESNDLSGSIPAEIGNLTKLERLYLYSNDSISGSIPAEIGNLINLEWLWLHSNNLSGTIPPEIGNMDKLERLDLSSNDSISGSIPAEIGNLVNLERLDLSSNQLSGTIPPEIGDMDKLERLDLHSNQLSGCFHQSLLNLCHINSVNIDTGNNFDTTWESFCMHGLGVCSPIQCLSLSNDDSLTLVALYDATNGNQWQNPWNLEEPMATWYGVTSIGKCIIYLNLSSNDLSGSIPAEIGNLSQLRRLDLSDNDLSGTIPLEIGNLSNLSWLYLADNDLSGSIPLEIGNLTDLEQLDLSDNDSISGTIPPEIGNLTYLEELNLRSNNLSGTIPPEIGNLTYLHKLDIGYNDLSGSIPPGIGNLTNLERLVLYSNKLSGGIPPEIGNLTNLETLNLGSNQLSGTIPLEIGNLTNLKYLALHLNQLSGTIPLEIGNLINLQGFLYLSSNQLSGTIPPEIGNLSKLERLNLSSNELSGTIPPEIGNFSDLWELNLSSNDLNGSIPPEIGNLSYLHKLNLSSNKLSGSIPPEIGNLTNLIFELNLSSNDLSGSIPPEIGNLTRLAGDLNLSSNDLSGSIPSEIGSLTRLDVLDLSSNDLSGSIPSEIEGLDGLKKLNLSYNQLSDCFHQNLSNLCNIDSVIIDAGNNFDATWEAFCIDTIGVCPPSLVLPGDFNNDGVADKTDLIYWGLAKGYTGYVRPNATTTWILQDSPEWDASIGGINCKHQDADGNGIIDEADLDVLISNYGNGDFSYGYSVSPAAYTLQQVSKDTVNGLKVITYELRLQANAPVNTHGISGSVEFDYVPGRSILLDTTGVALEPTHWIEDYDISGGKIVLDFAHTRTDKSNQLIDGPIARICVADKDLQIADPTDLKTNSGKIMSATGVVTSISGSKAYGSGANPTQVLLAINPAYCQAGGAAEVIVLEGTPPYAYTWSTGEASSRINDLDIGTYSVTVSDADSLSNVVNFEINWAFTPVMVSADTGQVCFNFEDAPLTEAVQVSLDDGRTYMPPITGDTCYAVSTGSYPVWIRLASDSCATFLTEVHDTCTSTLNITHIDDNDMDIGVDDTERFASNPLYVYAYDEPGLPSDAVLTNNRLELYFRVFGASCEQDIEVRITDPLGRMTTFQPFTTCNGTGTLYHTFLDVPDVSFTSNLSDWRIEFRDVNDNNPGLAEYSVRFARLMYDATFNACNSGTISTINKNKTLSELSEMYLYPVPATDLLNIEYTSDQERDLIVEIFDLTGRISINKKERILSGVNIFKININELPQAVYYVRVRDAFGRTQIKSFAKVSP